MSTISSTYRFQLDTSSKKFHCPSCGKKRFVRYVDTSTDDYLPDKYGRCDREQHCRYHFSPYEDGYAKAHFKKDNAWRRPVKRSPSEPPKYIPLEIFQGSKQGYARNSFVRYLHSQFSQATVNQLISKYHLGTSGRPYGGCVFYQIDKNGNIHRGKVMVYEPNGHKDPSQFHSVHARLGWKDCKPDYCYFGEHLLSGNDRPVAIVESEKTAIIASLYFPEFQWIATGSKARLNISHARALRGRRVILFPDIGGFRDWSLKAKELSHICNVTVSDYLERQADSEAKKKGYDLADFLIQWDLAEFLAIPNHTPTRENRLKSKYKSRKNGVSVENIGSGGYPADWDYISLSEGEQVFVAATRAALRDCDHNFERLKIKDSKVALLSSLFDAKPKHPDEIQLMWSHNKTNLPTTRKKITRKP
jgi:hypothetical protein